MKKLLLVLVMVLSFALVSCGTEAPKPDYSKSEGVMTYAQYKAAELKSEVVVEVFVQATQSWWDNKITVYAADPDGAYFIYNMACTQEDAAKLTKGTYIKVSGVKDEWKGEVEIVDATFEFVQKKVTYVASAFDATALLGKDTLIDHQNELVSFKGLTVVASKIEGDDTEYAFLYKYNGAGSDGDDLYFNVKYGETVYTFTVESYLCDNTTEVYKAVKELKVGDVIDCEAFAYWYDGLNPHVTKVVKK